MLRKDNQSGIRFGWPRSGHQWLLALAGGVMMTALLFGSANAQQQARSIKPQDAENPLPELVSGYYFLTAETRALQDDDFDNPGFLWVEAGQQLWKKKAGAAKKSCASCHKNARDTMATVGTRYPVYYEPLKKPINLEQRINICRTKYMKAKPFKYESNELLAMTAYVKHFSRRKPMNVVIDKKLEPFFEKGKKFYYTRRGQMNIACNQCHDGHYGNYIRANLLSQGHTNAFPAYRLKWQRLGSLHRRFRVCSGLVRANVRPYGADDYVNLELYLAWRGNGLPVETPGVRF